MTELSKLTPYQESLLPTYRDKWINIGLSTEPINKRKAREAIKKVYRCAGLEPPKKFIWCPGLLEMADQTRNQIRNQIRDQIRNQIRDQIRDQVWDQIRDQVWNQVRDQVWNQVRDQVWHQVRDQVWHQVWHQVRNQIRDQTRDQVGHQVRYQVWNQVWNQVCWGSMDAYWLSTYDFFQEACNIKFPRLEGLIEAAKTVGWFLSFKDVVYVSDRPTEIHFNEDKVLHKDGSAAVKYRDGLSLWRLNGVIVPPWLVETPAEQISIEKFHELDNAQVRAEFVRKVGLERCWYKLATVVDTYEEYELGDIPLGGEENRTGRYLKMHNPSVPELWHIEGVDNGCKTVEEALRWRQPEWMRKLPVDEVNGTEWYQQGDVVVVPRGATSVRRFPKVLT